MLAWFGRHLFVLAARLVVTLAACVSLQRVIQEEGYRCELSSLLIGAALTIVCLRVWMPWSRDT